LQSKALNFLFSPRTQDYKNVCLNEMFSASLAQKKFMASKRLLPVSSTNITMKHNVGCRCYEIKWDWAEII
jgi:hypothetical protein